MEKIKNYIILGLSVSLGFMIYFNTRPKPIYDDKTISIPGSTESSGVVIIDNNNDSIYDPEIIEVPVYIKGDVEIVVDQEYKNKYDQVIKEKDSISARNLYLESIQIKEYNEVAIDNDIVKVDLYAKTRGSLLAYRIDYNIKEKEFKYIPEVVYRYPKASLVYGLELGLPAQQVIPQAPVIGVSLGIQNKKGSIVTLGVNSEKFVTIGYYKTLKLFK